MQITLALLSDCHVAHSSWTETEKRLRALVDFFREQSVDLIVDLGDRIQEESSAKDVDLTRRFRAVLTEQGHKVVHLHGNHDIIFAPKGQLNQVLDKSGSYEAFTVNGYRVILLDSTDPHPAQISQEQLAWLGRQLDAGAGEPTILLSHHPLFPHDVSDHPYFSLHQEEAQVKDFQRLWEAVAKAEHICALFQGHLHILMQENYNGIPARVIPPLRDSVDTRFPQGGFTIASFKGCSFQERYYTLTAQGFKQVCTQALPSR